jgi:hypothetical protein
MSTTMAERELENLDRSATGTEERPIARAGGWLRGVAPLWPLGLARIAYGYLWWQQSGWKVPSDDFGRKSGGGLWFWVQQEIQHPTVPAYRDFLVNVMIPHWTLFGWMGRALPSPQRTIPPKFCAPPRLHG